MDVTIKGKKMPLSLAIQALCTWNVIRSILVYRVGCKVYDYCFFGIVLGGMGISYCSTIYVAIVYIAIYLLFVFWFDHCIYH